jgi:elongation factor G
VVQTFGLLELAMEAVWPADNARLTGVLEQLARAAPQFAFAQDPETGQSILRGADERELANAQQAIAYEMDGRVRFGAMQVACRETLSHPATVDYTYKKQIGVAGLFARVVIEFAPLPPGSGYVFEGAAASGAIPGEFIEPVDRGIRAQKESGLVAGFPVVDFMARLVGGAYHEVDSNAVTFEFAGRAAFPELVSRNVARLLEPAMALEVTTPHIFLGPVIGDINRRGQMRESIMKGEECIVRATALLGQLIGYANVLASLTENRAKSVMHFDHFEPVQIPPGDDPKFPGAAAQRAA